MAQATPVAPRSPEPADVVDLARHPIDRPGTSAYAALRDGCRAALATRGMFDLPGFMTPPALDAALSAIRPRMEREGFAHMREHNVYFRDDVPGVAPDHPSLRRFRTANRTLCADQLAGPVTATYEHPALRAFLADVLRRPALHLMDDPLARVNVMAYREGEALNWHFDRAEFTTTLLLQAPEAGGAFLHRPGLRSQNDPNHEGVARLLAGEDPDVRVERPAAGTLNVFLGRDTAHRVEEVRGPRARIVAVFSYYERPGVTFSPEERLGFYGRAS